MTSDSASRVTRSRRSLRRATLLFVAVLTGVAALHAQETAPTASPQQSPPQLPPPAPASAEATSPPQAAPPAAAATSEPAATKNGQDAAANANAPVPAAQDGKPAGRVGPTRDRFEPTEKVRADFDVSFPVDI